MIGKQYRGMREKRAELELPASDVFECSRRPLGVGAAIIIAAMRPGSYINFPITQGHGSRTAAGVP